MTRLVILVYDQADTGTRHVALMTEKTRKEILANNKKQKIREYVVSEQVVECDMLTVERIRDNYPVLMIT